MQSRYAIVKFPWGSSTERSTDPATVPLTDATKPKASSSKGTPILIMKWENFVKKINIKTSSQWLLGFKIMWINTLSLPRRAEQIVVSGNFLELIDECPTHWEVRAFYNDENTDLLNPEVVNWKNMPYLILKAVARGKWFGIFRVGNGKDVYFPVLKTKKFPHMWIRKDRVELFPPLPFALDDNRIVVAYILEGASVFGILSTGEKIYLRRYIKQGECWQEPSWPLMTEGVIPPMVTA